ncbi:general transcription factor iif subunit 2 [Plakobranchus ocellatus]|uniref:General transcription factor IIF subunit 2 n=1 Tax=Plakobranchus ocellatus TaxID=259542 RepID=A0AAV4B8Q2_9GAST|nr:general transcription factor iif subunit 2 [Plakobranchus ocellatus]
MSVQSDLEKAHAPRDVDVSAAGRGVWLVKVPKYLSDQWKSCPPGTDVGNLKISKSKEPNKKPDIVFTTFNVAQKKPVTAAAPLASSSASLSSVAAAAQPLVPLGQPKKLPTSQNHKFLVTNVGNQKLVVMSEAKSDNSGSDPLAGKICVEGRVMQRAECHPIVDSNYRQIKREQVSAHNTPQRQMKLLPGFVQTYKPVKEPVGSMKDMKAKKAEKRSRAEKDKVLDILYNAFEKHQFYNIKDLMGITKQPAPYLKEILKEICNYNMAAPHKYMWELKPEFRHYKSQEESGASGTT